MFEIFRDPVGDIAEARDVSGDGKIVSPLIHGSKIFQGVASRVSNIEEVGEVSLNMLESDGLVSRT